LHPDKKYRLEIAWYGTTYAQNDSTIGFNPEGRLLNKHKIKKYGVHPKNYVAIFDSEGTWLVVSDTLILDNKKSNYEYPGLISFLVERRKIIPVDNLGIKIIDPYFNTHYAKFFLTDHLIRRKKFKYEMPNKPMHVGE
jgi:hypothetical protein